MDQNIAGVKLLNKERKHQIWFPTPIFSCWGEQMLCTPESAFIRRTVSNWLWLYEQADAV